MPIPHFGARVLLLGFILAINAFFAGAEVSLLSVRESRLRHLAEQGKTGARIALQLLANPGRLLSVTQIGVTLASLGLGWAGEDLLYQVVLLPFHPVINTATSAVVHGASFVVAFLVMTYLHVIVGEVVPKNLGISKADQLALAVSPGLLLFSRIASPFVTVIERSVSAIMSAMGIRSERHSGGHSAEELKLIVASSRGAGHLPETQESMINRVLDLEDHSVREVMLPRNEMVSVAVDASLDDILQTMIEEQHSRLPVYEGGAEHIVGMVFYKDLLPLWQERRRAIREGRPMRLFRLAQLMRPPVFVPETKPLLTMLEQFRTGKSHMAIVVDEFGTVTGLLTIEDVLEQIVGEIEDEFDDERVEVDEVTGDLVLDGATKIRDLESQYGIFIPSDGDFETLAGYLLMRLGEIPAGGEKVEHAGRVFTVDGVERNRITRVKVGKANAGV